MKKNILQNRSCALPFFKKGSAHVRFWRIFFLKQLTNRGYILFQTQKHLLYELIEKRNILQNRTRAFLFLKKGARARFWRIFFFFLIKTNQPSNVRATYNDFRNRQTSQKNIRLRFFFSKRSEKEKMFLGGKKKQKNFF